MRPATNGFWSSLNVDVQWLPNGRAMRLLHDLTYTDKRGVAWLAPAGSIIDGASIPRLLWTLSGSPYVGMHRRASIIHDVYCCSQDRPHQAVHRMFYEAMIDSGVSPGAARRKYLAVKLFGPKWNIHEHNEKGGE